MLRWGWGSSLLAAGIFGCVCRTRNRRGSSFAAPGGFAGGCGTPKGVVNAMAGGVVDAASKMHSWFSLLSLADLTCLMPLLAVQP